MSKVSREPVDIPGTPRYQPPEGSDEKRALDAAVLAYTKGYNADVLAPYDQRHRLGVYAALRAPRPGQEAAPPTLTCPQCEAEGSQSTVRLNERFAGPGLYLAKWWCSNGHEWSVRSMPWGNDQRAVLRQVREANRVAPEVEDK